MIAMDEVRAIVQDLIPDGTTITVVGPLVWLPGNNGENLAFRNCDRPRRRAGF